MQEKKYLSYNKRPQFEFDLSEFLILEKTTVSNENLINLADKVLALITKNMDESKLSEISQQLTSIRNMQSMNSPYINWLNSKIASLMCKKCKKHPACKAQFPYFLCKRCLSEAEESVRCYLCQQNHPEDYKTVCKHLCIFCACMQLRKNKNECAVCNRDLKNLKFRQFDCDGCNGSAKNLIKDLILLLKCKHLHCGNCLAKCIKSKNCLIDNKPLSERNLKYIAGYLTDACYICKTRKPWNRFFSKSCCNYTICIKCQAESFECLGCNKEIANNSSS